MSQKHQSTRYLGTKFSLFVCLFVYITYTVWPCLALVNRDGLRIILKKSKPERGSGVTSPDLRRAGPENLKNDNVAIVKK